MKSDTSVVGPLIGVAGVIVGALLAALFALHRERLARRAGLQIAALYELQEVCLAHRQALQAFAEAQAVGPSPEHISAVDRSGQRLDLICARIRSDAALARTRVWRDVVRPALLREDLRPVSVAEENDAWLAVQQVVQEELRRLG